MGRARAAAGGLALAVVVLAGCFPESPTGPTTTARPTPSASPTPELPSPTGAPMEGEPGATGAPAPVWDDVSRADAVRVATEVMTAYARPTADPAVWWTDFSRYLSAGAQQDYQWVQPASIAASRVSGPAVVVDESSVYLARVDVPTDAGVHQVLLSRQDGPTPWVVERIVPPAEVGA